MEFNIKEANGIAKIVWKRKELSIGYPVDHFQTRRIIRQLEALWGKDPESFWDNARNVVWGLNVPGNKVYAQSSLIAWAIRFAKESEGTTFYGTRHFIRFLSQSHQNIALEDLRVNVIRSEQEENPALKTRKILEGFWRYLIGAPSVKAHKTAVVYFKAVKTLFSFIKDNTGKAILFNYKVPSIVITPNVIDDYVFDSLRTVEMSPEWSLFKKKVWLASQIQLITSWRIGVVKSLKKANLELEKSSDGSDRFLLKKFSNKRLVPLEAYITNPLYEAAQELLSESEILLESQVGTINEMILEIYGHLPVLQKNYYKPTQELGGRIETKRIPMVKSLTSHMFRKLSLTWWRNQGLEASHRHSLAGHAAGSSIQETTYLGQDHKYKQAIYERISSLD